MDSSRYSHIGRAALAWLTIFAAILALTIFLSACLSPASDKDRRAERRERQLKKKLEEQGATVELK